MNKPLNVLHVVERIDDKYGGPAKSIPYTAWFSSTVDSKHQIYAGRYEASDRNSTCDQLGLNYLQFDFFGSTKVAFSPGLCHAIYRFVRDNENPIVHVHSPWNAVPFSVWLLSLFVDFRIVVSVRGALFPWSLKQGRMRKMFAWKIFQKRLMCKADAVHVTSEEEREQVYSLGVRDNLKLIPNGVFLGDEPVNQATIINKDAVITTLRLLFVSRIHPKKGIEILLSALASESINFNVELIVAGDFSDETYKQKILGLLGNLGDNVSVTFLGHVNTEHLASLYAEADLFVLPSYTENFGIAVAEALTYGLPVITTVNTPWMEIKTQNAGYIIDTSVEELKEALVDFNNKSVDERSLMSQNARKLIKKYDWRNLASEYQSMYEQLI